MSTTYLSVDYFPLTVNFFDRDAIEPVSYTHLDVYKRQTMIRLG